MNINAKQKNVLHIITKYPDAANDEALLLSKYWWEIDGWNPLASLYDNLSKVTRPETITRRRRELYNMGLITYDQETTEEREEAFKAELDNASDYEAVPWMS